MRQRPGLAMILQLGLLWFDCNLHSISYLPYTLCSPMSAHCLLTEDCTVRSTPDMLDPIRSKIEFTLVLSDQWMCSQCSWGFFSQLNVTVVPFCEQCFSSWMLPIQADFIQCLSHWLISRWNTNSESAAPTCLFNNARCVNEELCVVLYFEDGCCVFLFPLTTAYVQEPTDAFAPCPIFMNSHNPTCSYLFRQILAT